MHNSAPPHNVEMQYKNKSSSYVMKTSSYHIHRAILKQNELDCIGSIISAIVCNVFSRCRRAMQIRSLISLAAIGYDAKLMLF